MTATNSRRVLPTRRSLWFSLIRACRLRVLRWQLDCLRDERERYLRAGYVGLEYLRVCRTEEQRLLARIRELEEA